MPPSVELLRPTTPKFSNPVPRPPYIKPDWHLCLELQDTGKTP